MKKYNFDIKKGQTSTINVPVGVKNKDAVAKVKDACRKWVSYHGLSSSYNFDVNKRKVEVTRVA